MRYQNFLNLFLAPKNFSYCVIRILKLLLFKFFSRSLPQSLRNKMKESRVARRTDVERVEEYIQHQRQALEACTGDSGEDRSRPWLKNTLATFYGETNHFQEPHRLLQVTMMIQKRQRLAPQTILTYLAGLKKFVVYQAGAQPQHHGSTPRANSEAVAGKRWGRESFFEGGESPQLLLSAGAAELQKSAIYELDLGNAQGNPTKRVGFDEQTQNRPILRRRLPCGAWPDPPPVPLERDVPKRVPGNFGTDLFYSEGYSG